MKRLRCGLIGCGRIGCGFDDPPNDKTIKTHAGSYYNNQKTKLVSLCDIDKSKLQKYGKKYNISHLYTNASEMFKKESLDCVSICTLIDSHLNLVKEAAKYNVKGIFLEKPISSSLQEARKIIDLCKESNITLIIDHKRRFDPFYHSLKKYIQNKKFGNIQLVNVYYGAGIANTCSHVFDMLRFFFGEVISVQSSYSKNKSGNKRDPNIDIELEFKDGFNCRLQALDLRHYGVSEMDIFGSNGRIRFNMETNESHYFKVSFENIIVYKNLAESQIKLKESSFSNIQLGVQNLVDCVLYDKKPLCTGYDGYKSLELIIASIKAARLGKKILIPLRSTEKIHSR